MFMGIRIYYLRSKTEFAGALHVNAIWDLHYQNCWIPVCDGTKVQQDDWRSWFSNEIIFSKKTGYIYKIGPPNALFRGVGDLVLVPSKGKPVLGETPVYLGGRLCTCTGHGTSQVVAENAMRSGKNAKTAKPPVNSCVAVPSENCTTKIAEFRFVVGSGWNRTIVSLEITIFFVKKLSIHRIWPSKMLGRALEINAMQVYNWIPVC